MKWFCVIVLAVMLIASAAFARQRHATDANGNVAGLVTVNTAAGAITVSPAFAPKITAFISDLVASGYTPKHVKCYARGGHVRGSRHYSGNACDFDQRGFGKTAARMYHVAALAAQHGLRDGGSFRDWGHIDDGKPLMRQRDYTPSETMIASTHGVTMVASARRKTTRTRAAAFVPPDRLTQYY